MTLPTIKGSKGILAIVRGRNKEEERRGSGAKEGRNTIVMMNPAEERECELYIYKWQKRRGHKSYIQERMFLHINITRIQNSNSNHHVWILTISEKKYKHFQKKLYQMILNKKYLERKQNKTHNHNHRMWLFPLTGT